MSPSRQARIEETRRDVGWAYDAMRWLSEGEAREAERERSRLLAALDGWVSVGFAGTKLHVGSLSPGCRICGDGTWGCHFVTRRCNTHCFYCPDSGATHSGRAGAPGLPQPPARLSQSDQLQQAGCTAGTDDLPLQAQTAQQAGCTAGSEGFPLQAQAARQIGSASATDDLPQTAGWVLRTAEEHVRFIAAFGIRGVSFTGGEPLLLLDAVLAHIRAMRQARGNSIYLWLYTNGILADDATLARLRDAGLDEIRFDIAACGYDLAPVARAVRYVPTVTIEIPAIPRDLDVMARLLPEIERIGVAHLNLHQLIAGPHNYRALQQLGYRFLHQPLVPVMESEPCALRLLLSARERGLSLPINYCCSAYKSRFQPRGDRLQASRLARRGHEEVTGTGYLRSFLLSAPAAVIESTQGRFRGAGHPPSMWELQPGGREMLVHPDLLPHVDSDTTAVALQYAEPRLRLKDPAGEFSEGNLAAASTVVCRLSGWSHAAHQAQTLTPWETLEEGLPEIS